MDLEACTFRIHADHRTTHSSTDTLRVTTPYGGPRAGGKDSANSKGFQITMTKIQFKGKCRTSLIFWAVLACVAPGDFTVAMVLSTV